VSMPTDLLLANERARAREKWASGWSSEWWWTKKKRKGQCCSGGGFSGAESKWQPRECKRVYIRPIGVRHLILSCRHLQQLRRLHTYDHTRSMLVCKMVIMGT
jgi:hypothetical protein